MPTNLLSVISWVRPFIGNMLLLNDGTLDPAVTNANIILGMIFSPPFVWEWNRSTAPFSCIATLTDTTVALPDFGFLESAALTVPSGATADANMIYQLQFRRTLETNSSPGRPSFISVFMDDQQGNITFRVGSANPDQAYPVIATYQKAYRPITSVHDIVPIPDKLMHIFRYGFMALAFLYTQDTRFAEINQKFIATLLGAQQGLDSTQRNIFLGQWYSMMSDEGMVGLNNQQGTQARGAQ